MKLPNGKQASVQEAKLTKYLLNPAHIVDGSKTAFFLRFGFTVNDWLEMADALLRHAQDNDVVLTEETRHGTRYVVDGPLRAPDGSSLNIRSAWFIDSGSNVPRFVTAHPLPRI